MDPHERFMKHRTIEVTHFLTRHLTHLDTLNQLVERFNDTVLDLHLYPDALHLLETLHTVLCSFYQQKFNPDLRKPQSDKFNDQHNRYPFKRIKIFEIQKILYTRFNAKLISFREEVSLILDILVLHMFLFHSENSVWTYLEKLQDLIHEHLTVGNDVKDFDIRFMNCYIDSLLLHQRNSQSTDNLKQQNWTTKFLNNLKIWLTLKGCRKRELLTVLLPKLVKLYTESEILSRVWEIIFQLKNDPNETLSILCLTADLWFPITSNYSNTLIAQTVAEPFWVLLLKGASSPMPQQRKQTLYLIKRVVDFVDKHKTLEFDFSNYQEIKPLIFIGNGSQQESFKENLYHFSLILEALEEKPTHLVSPVFPLLKTLLNQAFYQGNHATGSNITWIRCLFTRILQHDNNTIVKCGLLNVFALDQELYNDEFLSLVLEVLNHTYLYENDTNRAEPTIVEELTKLLNNAEIGNSDLVARLLLKASKIKWHSIALFHVIHALSMVEKVRSVCTEVDLEAVKSLAKIMSAAHCQILRIGSQVELLEFITRFATESLDLVAIATTLSAFSTDEILIRSQLFWKQICTWLSKIVKKEEALNLLQKTCEQWTNGNFKQKLDIKSFSLIIMLLHDAQLIFNSKLCPGINAFRNLLHCLIGADSRPYGNSELRNAMIELIGHLLGFTTSKDRVLYELIFIYVDPILRLTCKNLRKTFNEAFVNNIDTYVLITRQIFKAECSIITKREILNHIEKFEIESWNIIDDGEFSNNVQRLFGIKILCACLKATDAKLRNYKFIGPLCNIYKSIEVQLPAAKVSVNETHCKSTNLAGKIAAGYYKYVAELFYEYIQNELIDAWIPGINWIEEVLYLTQVGNQDIFVSLVGILSQLFYKGAIAESNMTNFISALRLCWKSILELSKCQSAVKEVIKLLFSSPFLECKETRGLTIEFIHEIIDKEDIPGLSLILLEGLQQAKTEYLNNFYGVILACLLHGTILSCDQRIEIQTCSYVLDRYQEVYPNYLSNVNVNTNAATRAHAIIILHNMITDDPIHAVKLLLLIIAKLDKSKNKQYSEGEQMQYLQNRIMQILLVLQPVLDKVSIHCQDDVQSLYSLIHNDILLANSQPSVRIMQEWLLIRLYIENDTLRNKIWDLFNQGQEQRTENLCSVVSIVYHVARLLPLDVQLEFINLAFQYITPYCMAQQCDVRLYAQVVMSKLYDFVTEMSYSTVMERYREFYIAVTKSLEHGNPIKYSTKLQDNFYFTVFNPIDDYSLQTLFYDLPRLSNMPLDEYIPPQIFTECSFKESNSHPLKLLNLKNDVNEAYVSLRMFKSSRIVTSTDEKLVTHNTDSREDCSSNIKKEIISWDTMTPNEEKVDRESETFMSQQKSLTAGNNIILVASLIDKLPDVSGLSKTCKILGVKEFVVSSIKHIENEEFRTSNFTTKDLISLTEVKPYLLEQYLVEKKNMNYQLIGVEQTINSKNLMDVKFNKKTVVLLGNEKAGIPGNILPLLDKYMVIPQVVGARCFDV